MGARAPAAKAPALAKGPEVGPETTKAPALAKGLAVAPASAKGRVAAKGPLADLAYQLVGGLRSGMGYCGARDIGELQDKARFLRI